MSFTGIVKNGVISLPNDIQLPEGTEVTVQAHAADSAKPEGGEPGALLREFQEFAGAVDSGLGDLADNHDHYLYGLPKRVK